MHCNLIIYVLYIYQLILLLSVIYYNPCTRVNSYIPYTHIHTYIRTHTYIYTYSHTHTRTHTYIHISLREVFINMNLHT